jgi:hypothetical protein
MKAGLLALYSSVIRITGSGSTCNTESFLGTGLVVSVTSVITCSHVVEGLVELSPHRGERLLRPCVLSESAAYRATGFRRHTKLDLCVLTIPGLPRALPSVPVRAGSLKGRKLVALGFDARDPDRIIEVHDLVVISEGLHHNRNQWAQIAGGLPGGFSGAPVLASTGGGWRVVGIVHLGGDGAPTSRMIGVDAMASFLIATGISMSNAVLSSQKVRVQPRSLGELR